METVCIPPLWKNPEIQELNRLPMRSPLLPFASADEAVVEAVAGPEFRDLSKSNWYMSLDGTWRFSFYTDPAEPVLSVPAEHSDTIQVPGTWTLQGYDKPHYTNIQMPFDALPPEVPDENPTGVYYKTFRLPDSWKNRRVVLHIGSAESVCILYVNGTFAGAGKDTRLPSEFDITPFIRYEAENTLCVKVIRYSDASYVEDQDQWWFGGIHRSVYLYTTAKQYIQDISAVPAPVTAEAGGGRSGTLLLAVSFGGTVNAGSSCGNSAVPGEEGTDCDTFDIAYAMYPFVLPGNRTAAEQFPQKTKPVVSGTVPFACNYRINSCIAEIPLTVHMPAMWSHEYPNLYVIAVSISRNGTHIESTAFCTGFRSVEIAERELRINGRKVYIKGVNRHEHDEKNGKTLSTASMIKDIMLLKQHNCNAVRTCHYPDDERWYELCDRYGIYLMDEANIENHCFYDQLCRDQRWAYAYASRVQRMVLRDKNHPSVIIWSLGNESGDGENQAMCGAWVRRADPSRPVHYEGFIRPERGQGDFTLDSLSRGKELTDIVGPMYPSIKLITDYAKFRDDCRPLIMCEYSHAMGNSNGSLADYWKAIESYHGLQGGYIWDWIDQGLKARTPDGTEYWKYGGDFGDEPTDNDFCLNGLLFPDQTPKPAMAECRQVFAPVSMTPVPGTLYRYTIKNKFDFSPLNCLEMRWTMHNERTLLASGVTRLPPAAPGESIELDIPVPDSIHLPSLDGTTYLHADFSLTHSTLWARAGFTVASAEHILRETPAIPCTGQNTAAYDLPDGSMRNSAEMLLDFARRFKPALFRVPTENDGLKTYFHLNGDPAAAFLLRDKAAIPWLELDLLHMEYSHEQFFKSTDAGKSVYTYTADLTAGKNSAAQYARRRLGSSAIMFSVPETGHAPLEMEICIDLDPSLPELPRAGITARIPSAYTAIEWFGAGPHESYCDRCTGAFLGHYTHTIAELEVPYIVPQENGNRTGVRELTVKGTPSPVTIRAPVPVQFSVSRYTAENMMHALHTSNLYDTTAGENGFWTLNIDCAHRGVGTGACGPDTLEQYRVRPGRYTMLLYLY